MRIPLSAWFFLCVLAVESVFVFPGRTYLQSDTQIYVPLFEHLRDRTLLRGELILEGAHLRYTIYDEVTLAIAAWTGAGFEAVLLAQQLVFRFLGTIGAYLLARSCGLTAIPAVLVSGVLWLGAFVYGPAIITTEYEPVPRGFAVPLTVLALGLLAAGARSWVAGVPLGAALLYHAPAIWPVVLVAIFRRDWMLLAPVSAAGLILVWAGAAQEAVVQAQPFFSLISDTHRRIQQLRAPYNWLYQWQPRYFWTFLLTGGLSWAAARRLRGHLPERVQAYFVWLPAIGFATIPLSLLLQERLGWALLPQVQPMRSLLYCHLFCQWLGAIAAAVELREGRWIRSALWLAIPLSLAIRGDLLLLDDRKWQVEAALLAGIAMTCWIGNQARGRYLAPALLAVPFLFAWQGDGAPKPLESGELRGLANWAREQTSKEAMFLFPDLGRRLEPGIFRARSARAVYVCWKQGGQVNYFAGYAEKWLERWTNLLVKGHAALDYEDLRRRGIDFIVLTKDAPKEPLRETYTSPGGAYRVYSLR